MKPTDRFSVTDSRPPTRFLASVQKIRLSPFGGTTWTAESVLLQTIDLISSSGASREPIETSKLSPGQETTLNRFGQSLQT